MGIPEFEDLCFDFGVELDDVTSEREMAMRELATTEGETAAKAQAAQLSDRVILKIDVSANRYDLLCAEGLARALKIFLGKEQPPIYRAVKPPTPLRITVKKEVCIECISCSDCRRPWCVRLWWRQCCAT